MHRKIGNRWDPLQVLLALGKQLSSELGTTLNTKVHTLLTNAVWLSDGGVSAPNAEVKAGHRL